MPKVRYRSIFANSVGQYALYGISGTLIPKPENPFYFNVNPSNFQINLAQGSTYTQDFLIYPNGVKPDMEVTILPLNEARPGVDLKYKVFYKNKGNTIQSGTVNLLFDDSVLDKVSSSPVNTTESLNNLSWPFSNMKPYEQREILVVFNSNTPLEVPPVDSGFQLKFTASVSAIQPDQTPLDNIFELTDVVVNSLDPNDKICLQGITISPDKVGEYVHYMIRFENIGTAVAQHVVIKDMIDFLKLDITTMQFISSSHPVDVQAKGHDKLEFFFRNINLPFLDQTNDGYVYFKIKTRSNLVVGDSFSNTASIYFDYNSPITTNTVTTTVQVLRTEDFSFDNYFSLYPNPVSDHLNFLPKQNIQVNSISIFNVLGQMVITVPTDIDTKIIDVSELPTGNYFIKINSDKGTTNKRFIKK